VGVFFFALPSGCLCMKILDFFFGFDVVGVVVSAIFMLMSVLDWVK